VSLGVAVLEANVLTLDIPEIIEGLSKRVEGRPGLDRQDTDRDYFPCRTLRTCGERPSSRADNQSNELAAFIKKTRSHGTIAKRVGSAKRLRSARDLPFSSSRVGRRPVGNLLDHLIGTDEQDPRDHEAERLCGLEINHQLKLHRL
jgi:hypothetical protein